MIDYKKYLNILNLNEENFMDKIEVKLNDLDKEFYSDPNIPTNIKNVVIPSEFYFFLKDFDKSPSSLSEKDKNLRQKCLNILLKLIDSEDNDNKMIIVIVIKSEINPSDIATNLALDNEKYMKDTLRRTLNLYLEELNPKPLFNVQNVSVFLVILLLVVGCIAMFMNKNLI